MRYKVTLQNGPERATHQVDIEDTGHPVQNNIRAIEAARHARGQSASRDGLDHAGDASSWEPVRVEAVAP